MKPTAPMQSDFLAQGFDPRFFCGAKFLGP